MSGNVRLERTDLEKPFRVVPISQMTGEMPFWLDRRPRWVEHRSIAGSGQCHDDPAARPCSTVSERHISGARNNRRMRKYKELPSRLEKPDWHTSNAETAREPVLILELARLPDVGARYQSIRNVRSRHKICSSAHLSCSSSKEIVCEGRRLRVCSPWLSSEQQLCSKPKGNRVPFLLDPQRPQ